jgi:dehydrogenase/reductase SDR family protein 1
MLRGQTAIVTGASRGVGRGIAIALATEGVRVFASGRNVDAADLPDSVTAVRCDHLDDNQVERLFARALSDSGRLDILVNNAWGGYERMVEGARFTWGDPFWEQPRWRWQAMMDTGVRGAFVASQLAARAMVPAQRGLIVNVSFWAAQKPLGNAIYGIAKAATDKLTCDIAKELAAHRVTAVSLYPGLVRTEAVLAANVFDLSASESPEFSGRAIAALAADPEVARWNGRVVVAAELARIYGFTDIDGRTPPVLSLDNV